ncbi:MAG: hypothetical protein QXQ40_01820 [Candidatus Aenigmatarchaeota archaeon]
MNETYKGEIIHRDEELVQSRNDIRNKTLREKQTARESYEAGVTSSNGKETNDELAYLRAELARLRHYQTTIAPLEVLAESENAMIQNQHYMTKLDIALLPGGKGAIMEEQASRKTTQTAKNKRATREAEAITTEKMLNYIRGLSDEDFVKLSRGFFELIGERVIRITPPKGYCEDYLKGLSKEELERLGYRRIENNQKKSE